MLYCHPPTTLVSEPHILSCSIATHLLHWSQNLTFSHALLPPTYYIGLRTSHSLMLYCHPPTTLVSEPHILSCSIATHLLHWSQNLTFSHALLPPTYYIGLRTSHSLMLYCHPPTTLVSEPHILSCSIATHLLHWSQNLTFSHALLPPTYYVIFQSTPNKIKNCDVKVSIFTDCWLAKTKLLKDVAM